MPSKALIGPLLIRPFEALIVPKRHLHSLYGQLIWPSELLGSSYKAKEALQGPKAFLEDSYELSTAMKGPDMAFNSLSVLGASYYKAIESF